MSTLAIPRRRRSFAHVLWAIISRGSRPGLVGGLSAGILLIAGITTAGIIGGGGSSGGPTGTTTTVPSGDGNVFVAPNGSDAGAACTWNDTAIPFPADRTTVCATIGKAHALAFPHQAGGAVVILGNGNYAGDTRTILAADYTAGGTNLKVASVSNLAPGYRIRVGTEGSHPEESVMTNVGTAGAGGTGITFSPPFVYDHPTGSSAADTNTIVCRGSALPPCDRDASDATSGQVVFQAEARHGAIVHGSLSLGSAQNGHGNAPSYVTFDGVDIEGQTFMPLDADRPKPSHITFTNGHIWQTLRSVVPSRGLVDMQPADEFVIGPHMEIGPACCNNDAQSGGSNANVPENLVIRDSTIHDLYDSCRFMPAAVKAQYGCGGIGFGDMDLGSGFPAQLGGVLAGNIDASVTTIPVTGANLTITDPFAVQIGSEKISVTGGYGTNTWTVTRGAFGSTAASHSFGAEATYIDIGYIHVDGLQIWGALNMQVLRNKWYAIGANGDPVGQTIFLAYDDLGLCDSYFDGVDIENNAIYQGAANNNAVSLGKAGGDPGCDIGVQNVRIVNNTVWSSGGAPGGNISLSDIQPATSVVVANNIVRQLKGFSAPGCPLSTRPSSGPFIPTYRHNLIGDGTCDATDHQGNPTFVNADPLDPNQALVQNGQWAINAGDPTYCPATDILGVPRPPGVPCDVGAYQG